MTDNEAICTAIVGGFTLLAAAVRWSTHVIKGVAGRVVKAIDDSTAAWTKTSETVQLLVRDVAGLKQQIDVTKTIQDAVDEVVDEVSGVHTAAPQQPAPQTSRSTPAGGYHVLRQQRKGGS